MADDDRRPGRYEPSKEEKQITAVGLNAIAAKRKAEELALVLLRAGITGDLDVAREIERLADAVTALRRDDRVPAPNWVGIDDVTRERQMAELTAWVETVLIPFFPGPPEPPMVKQCWPDHPGVVWELSVVAALWRRAYEQERPDLERVAEWLNRWRPDAAERVSEAQADCQPGRQDGKLWVCAVTRRRRDIAS